MSQSGKREPGESLMEEEGTVTPAVTSLRRRFGGARRGYYKPGWGLSVQWYPGGKEIGLTWSKGP